MISAPLNRLALKTLSNRELKLCWDEAQANADLWTMADWIETLRLMEQELAIRFLIAIDRDAPVSWIFRHLE